MSSSHVPTLFRPRDTMNPFTKLPYTAKYHKLLEKRMDLPVWEHKAKFMELIVNNQVVVLVGETGSGKTTQVSSLL